MCSNSFFLQGNFIKERDKGKGLTITVMFMEVVKYLLPVGFLFSSFQFWGLTEGMIKKNVNGESFGVESFQTQLYLSVEEYDCTFQSV